MIRTASIGRIGLVAVVTVVTVAGVIGACTAPGASSPAVAAAPSDVMVEHSPRPS